MHLSRVFSEKTLEYSHLMAELHVFFLLFTISLGRPEIFEKVAKIGVGCIFGSYKSPNGLTIKCLIANNSGYDLLSLDTVFFIYLKK